MTGKQIMEKKERLHYIDALNVIAALSVVFLHVNGCYWKYTGEESLGWWKSANVIEALFYFTVPVFFMISGATLLDYNKKYGLKEYIKKRVVKTFIPYIIWSLIGISVNIFFRIVPLSDVSFKYVIKGLLENTFVPTYWFFKPLFCIYLSIPLIAAVEPEKKVSVYTYTVIAAFFINVCSWFIINVFHLRLSWEYTVAVASGYLFHVLTGYILINIEIKRLYRIILYVFAIAGLFAHMIGTYYLTIKEGNISPTYKGYNNLPTVLYSLGVFVFIKYGSARFSEKLNKVMEYLSGLTFGVYLVHVFLIKAAERFLGIDNTNLIYRIIAPFVFFFASAGIVWILKKIPVVKHIVP